MAVFNPLKPGGKNGLARDERRDPMGVGLAALSRLAQSEFLDRFGMRKQTEHLVFTSTRNGLRTVAAASRTFKRVGGSRPGLRVRSAPQTGVFDLTATEDEQMLVDVVAEFATEIVRPAAAEANETCEAPIDVLKASVEIGLPILGVPEELGGITEERSAVAGVLVAEALSRGDMGLALACLAPGAVATAIGLWGSEVQQQTYLPAFSADSVPAAALALSERAVLFDVMKPSTTATRTGSGYVLNGVKTGVVRGAEAELFVVGADLAGTPVLFLLESSTPGLSVEADPSMGVRAAGLCTLTLDDVRVEESAVLGGTDASAYVECVRLSRLGWCALAVGTGQAVLDYVSDYVKQRHAFGEPIAHRQSVAFMVANIAIELQGMRLLTYKAAGRASAGKDISREVALARKQCGDKGMQIGLDGVQLLGGHGFVKEHPVERWYRDLRAISIMEGAVLV
ncbi:MAG: acyl-CoA dehydrogenase family protein [Nocardioides sp.]